MAKQLKKPKAEIKDEVEVVLEKKKPVVVDDTITYTMLAGYKDENGTLHKEFTLREMTGKDEEAIGKSDVQVNPAKVALVLLSRCVRSIGTLTPKDVGKTKWEEIIRDLLVGDQDYMLLKLREISIGEEIEVEHVCSNKKCATKLKTTLLVNEIEISHFKGNREIEFELPRGYKDKKGEIHTTGVMRLPNGLDRELLVPLAKKNLAKAETMMLTRTCKFDDGLHIDEDVMSSLVVKDRDYLAKLLKENTFGLVLETEVECDVCGETFRGLFNPVNFI